MTPRLGYSLYLDIGCFLMLKGALSQVDEVEEIFLDLPILRTLWVAPFVDPMGRPDCEGDYYNIC